MRYSKCLITVLLAGVVLAGCSNSKRDSSERLGSQIDEARRLFDHATAILANPQEVVETTAQQPPPTDDGTPNKDANVSTVKPVDYPLAEKKLAQARKILKKAISDNPDATIGTKSDAIHLLGKIHLASGKYYSTAVDCLRCKADDLRLRSYNALALARSNSIQAQFGTKLANLPKDKITTLRDATAKHLTELNAAITKIDKEIRLRQKANTDISRDNAKLLEQVRKMRNDGEVAGGTKGLALFKQARVIESKVNDKAREIAANQQAIEILKFNKTRLQQKQTDTGVKLAAVKKRLQDMADFGRSTMLDVKVARQRASERWQDAQKRAKEVVECCKKIAEREKLAIDALDNAVKRLNEAKKTIRRQINAANAAMKESDKPNEILQTQSDERNLAAVITDKSSASLTLGDLRRRQIITAKANADLADAITKYAGAKATTLVNELKGYLAEADKTKKLAEENYKEAENELKGILKLRFKGNAKNDLWMCQALLANAYLGHYELTGQNDVLADAVKFVNEALDKKENSQYLEQVVKLQQLIGENVEEYE
ncbi:MAG: hypothetical protein KAV00_05825 [Phycisphaerae bacterium]|nr:hypothetical protein [Phycisphaerae bacterium]